MSDRTWELMQKHLESGCYYIVSSQDSAPDAETLRGVFQSLGCPLPDEFLWHATNRYGGLYVEVNEDLWPRPKEFDVGPFWSFLYGLYTLNVADGIPDFMNLAEAATSFQDETGLTAVPFLKVIGDADVYCFDKKGTVVRWDHETNEIEPVGMSFFQVLDHELGELAARKDRKISGK